MSEHFKDIFKKNCKTKRNRSLGVELGNKVYWKNRVAEERASKEESRQRRAHARYGSGGTEAKRTKGNIGAGKMIIKQLKFIKGIPGNT